MAAPQTHQERMNKIREEHAEKVKREREKHAQRLKARTVMVDETIAESTERRKLADELDVLKERLDDEYTLHSRSQWRRFYATLELPMNADMLEELEYEQQHTGSGQRTDPDVVRWRTWIEGVCQERGIAVKDHRDPRILQGMARTTRKTVIIPPIISIATALIAAHEVGHCVIVPRPDAPSKKTAFLTTICVANEIDSWRWVMGHAPFWNASTHEFMKGCLSTYRKHATEKEAFELDWLVGPSGLRESRLLQARKGL